MYTKKVERNIFPLSRSEILSEALKEWYFDNQEEDYEGIEETCELCEHEGLRYHFLIKNKYTDKILWVGSKCILKFKLPSKDGELFDEKETNRKFRQLVKDRQVKLCIKALRSLALTKENDKYSEIFKNALDFFVKNNYLTPNYAFVVFRNLKESDIEYHPSFFTVRLNKKKYQDDLREMESYKIKYFWKALTSEQKKMVKKLGHDISKFK